MRNIPPVMRMVWECGPKTVLWSAGLRIALATLPAAILKVSNWLINAIYVSLTHHPASPLPHDFWWVVGLEFEPLLLPPS